MYEEVGEWSCSGEFVRESGFFFSLFFCFVCGEWVGKGGFGRGEGYWGRGAGGWDGEVDAGNSAKNTAG